MNNTIQLTINDSTTFSKTVGESDIYLFAGITGDFADNHINADFMKKTSYGKVIAHGVLLLGFASTACTKMAAKSDLSAVSYGFNRIRFTNPVFVGDTITATYTIKEIDESDLKSYSQVEIRNQNNELCLIAEHILKFFY